MTRRFGLPELPVLIVTRVGKSGEPRQSTMMRVSERFGNGSSALYCPKSIPVAMHGSSIPARPAQRHGRRAQQGERDQGSQVKGPRRG
jgi:hypothetical protein